MDTKGIVHNDRNRNIEVKTLKVIMIKNDKGSVDGIHIEEFEEGVVYDLTENLANSFILMESARPYLAEEVEPIKVEPSENKAVKPKSNKATK